MPRFLVDVNLPYYFSLWNNEDYVHQVDIDKSSTDVEIWNYSKENELIIISKDADFYNQIMFSEPPPKVIHIKVGNMKLKDFHDFLTRNWDEVLNMIAINKLVVVYNDRIEGIK